MSTINAAIVICSISAALVLGFAVATIHMQERRWR
jgi:hypothetical protein